MEQQLYIKEVKGKGRGVFCTAKIPAGEIIEVCPVIVVPADDAAAIQNTRLTDYSFYFNREEETLSLVMGFGSVYNYARYPNALYVLNPKQQIMIYTAYCDIPAHTEITINYSGEYGRDYSKWFTDRAIAIL
ncbi:MAG: SET domain-containing protein-lysine N-methyltransferase [Chitinophagaceae bacterium]